MRQARSGGGAVGCGAILATALSVVLCVIAGPVAAGDLTVTVVDAHDKPVRDAVVTFTPSQAVAIPARLRAVPYTMSQKSMTFIPFVLAVPEGATVSFPNLDTVRHHVYSLSPAHPFQLPLYGPGQTRSVEFDRAGTISLACDIHDSMRAFIRVVATPWFATTGEGGKVVLGDVPAGAGRLVVWQPLMEGAQHEDARAYIMPAGDAAQSVPIKLHARPAMPGM